MQETKGRRRRINTTKGDVERVLNHIHEDVATHYTRATGYSQGSIHLGARSSFASVSHIQGKILACVAVCPLVVAVVLVVASVVVLVVVSVVVVVVVALVVAASVWTLALASAVA